MTRNIGRKLPGPVSIAGAMIPIEEDDPEPITIPREVGWCVCQSNADVTGDTRPFSDLAIGWTDGTGDPISVYAKANIPIWDQSGGFQQVDRQTIRIPEGVFSVEWAFTISLTPDGVPPYLGDGWARFMYGLNSTGPLGVHQAHAPWVQQATSFNEVNIIPVETFASGPIYVFRSRGVIGYRTMIRSWGVNRNLQLGLFGYLGLYPKALDEDQAYFMNFKDASFAATGHYVKIMGALDF